MLSPLFELITEAFALRGWNYEVVKPQEVIESHFDAYHTRVRLHVQAFDEIGAVSVVGYASVQVPAARCGLIAEALMRYNQTLTLGNIEMDYDSGRVFFRITNIFASDEGGPAIIGSMVHSTIAEIDRLTPLLTILLRQTPEELRTLNLKLFLQREDLLPPVSDTPESSL